MDNQHVIEALKRKLINEQRNSANNEAKQEPNHAPSPYSRARRDERVVQKEPVSKEEDSIQPSNSGVISSPYNSRDIRDARDVGPIRTHSPKDSRDDREYRGKRDYYSSRDHREHQDGQMINSRAHDSRSFRDNRDYRNQRDYREREYREYSGRSNYRERDTRDSYRNTYRDDRFDYRSDYRDNGRDRYAQKESVLFHDEDLANVIPIDKLPRKSLWDIRPKGFEKISAEKAKISGLFPLPGEARRVDISSLEGLVSSGDLNSQTAILFEQKSIDATSSRISKQLIITGVEFGLFPAERLVEVLKNYINSLNLKESFITGYELINSKFLVLQLSDSNVTTILFSSIRYLQKELNLKIKIDRPEGYITPIIDPEAERVTVIPDSKDKIAITNVPSDIQKEEILEDLQGIADVEAIELIADKENASKGIVFVKFTTPSEEYINQINGIVIGEVTLNAIYASRSPLIQQNPISYRSFASIVSTTVPESRIPTSSAIVLLNSVRPEDLKTEEGYKQLESDIFEECSKFGKVNSIKIPKPDEKYKRTIKNLHTSVGKVFVKFGTKDEAHNAVNELHGRRYNQRTILVSYISVHDYDLNIF